MGTGEGVAFVSHGGVGYLRRRRRTTVCATAGSESAGRVSSSRAAEEPILLRAARGEAVERPPVWLMRQAGRYMAAFRKYSDKIPFRERSETPEIAIELSLQPWRAFATDAVIMFSDILTPLPAIGIEFDVVRGVGPQIMNPVRTAADLRRVGTVDQFDPAADLHFVGETLRALRSEIAGRTALLGFVGCPWTLAAYSMQGRADKNLVTTKRILFQDPQFAHAFLKRLALVIGEYAVYQVRQGAQAIQLFDSWAHHLHPHDYEQFALPYAAMVAERVRSEFGSTVPIIFFANGCGGKLESIKHVLHNVVDVVQVDWSIDIATARAQLGHSFVLQGNLDPTVLFGSELFIRDSVRRCCQQAGPRHILNLGHGVLQDTPESAVHVFCQTARDFKYDDASLHLERRQTTDHLHEESVVLASSQRTEVVDQGED